MMSTAEPDNTAEPGNTAEPDNTAERGTPDSGDTTPTGTSRPARFPPAARWTIVFVVVMVALVVAIWPRGDDDPVISGDTTTTVGTQTSVPVDAGELAGARTEAALADCPAPAAAAGAHAALAGIVAECVGTGRPYNLGDGTAGTPLLVNMWATWCYPCRQELPVLADYAARAGTRVNVLTVHAKEGAANPYLVLRFLGELGVHLPATLDTDGKCAAALRAPRVFPSTILLRADGTVAKVLPQVFDNTDEIAGAVRTYLGVDT